MKPNQIIKLKREEQKLSQEYMAYVLGISQSQYSRREHGIVAFKLHEITKAAKVLEMEVLEIIAQKTKKSFTPPTGGRADNPQYEARLKEKDEMISLLREKLSKGGVIR